MDNPDDDGKIPQTDDAPRRIAFCITDLDPGGAEWALYQIATRLDRRRWDPIVFCLGPEAPLARKLRDAQCPVECYGARSWRNLGAIPWLGRRLREFDPHLLHSFLFHANIVSRLAGWRVGVKLIVSGHRVAEREKRWHLWLDRLTCALSHHHIAVSLGVKHHLMKHLRLTDSQISVVRNGVERREFPRNRQLLASLGVPQDCMTIIAAGRLHPQKGFDTLLEAFQTVAASEPNVHLLLVGEGPLRAHLKARIIALNLVNRVTMTGYRKDLPRLMAACDMFVLSSIWEGMPNVLLEAMAAGLPILATNVEGVPDVLLPADAGLLVTPPVAAEFVKTIQHLLHHPQAALEMGRRAQDYSRKELTWETSIREYDCLFTDLLAPSVSP